MGTRILNNNKAWIYDLESFNNFYSACFRNVVTKEEVMFYIHKDVNQFRELLSFVHSDRVGTLIGFNSYFYDDKLLSYMFENMRVLAEYDSDTLTNILCRATNFIIKDDKRLRIRRTAHFESIDLYKLLGFRRSNVSLKRCAVNMGMKNIQDLPFPPGSDISLVNRNIVLDYNWVDIDVTEALFIKEQMEIKLREFMEDKYHMNLYNADRTYLGKLIFIEKFNAKVSDEYKISFSDLRKWKTVRETIPLADAIDSRWEYETPAFKNILADLKEVTVHVVNDKMRVWSEEKNKYIEFKYKTEIDGMPITIGLGGLHSSEKKIIIEAMPGEILWENDFSSYYPNLIVSLGICPAHFEHVKAEFCETVKEMIADRIYWKDRSKESAEAAMNADILKISINSLFGLMGSKYFAFYDLLAVLRITINGQLGLLKGIEMCAQRGVKTETCNTDGFVIYAPESKAPNVLEVVRELENIVGCDCDVSKYSKIINKDVNNYIWETDTGKLKQKGVFLSIAKRRLDQSVNHPIIVEATNKYFMNGTNITDTITSSTDISKFTMTRRLGIEKSSGLNYKLYTVDSEEYPVEEQQKTTRFYCSTVGYRLKRVGQTQSAFIIKDQPVTIFNRHIDKPFEEYMVDKSYYINQATKMVANYKTINYVWE